jgi:hypothetical protein
MFWKILLVGMVVLAVMVAIKDGRVLRATDLTGSCALVSTAPNGVELKSCHSGKLHGAPNLSGRGCTDVGAVGGKTYWRCPPKT